MEYKYRLIKFLNKKKIKEIDIVPTTWLHYDKTSDTLHCKFMPAPYTKEQTKKLIHMVRKCELPQEEWLSYPIDLVGRAYSYEEAERKAIRLENQPYAYSTDNECRAKNKAFEDKKNFKFKSISKTSVHEELNKISIDVNANMESNKCNVTAEDDSSSYSSSNNKGTKKKTHARYESKKKQCSKNRKNSILSDDEFGTVAHEKERREKNTKNHISDDDSENSENTFMKPKALKIHDNNKKTETSSKSSFEEAVHFSKDDTDYENNICDIAERYYRSLSKQIGYLQGEIINLSLLMKEMQKDFGTLKSKENIELFLEDDNEEMGVSFPYKSYEEFQEFDTKLSVDETFRQKIMHRMLMSINKRSTIRRNTGLILRTYLSQDLAVQFTTVKAIFGKYVFCNSNLYKCIQDVMRKTFSESDGTILTSRTFQESVQAIFNNAKDWNGQGHIRKQKPKK